MCIIVVTFPQLGMVVASCILDGGRCPEFYLGFERASYSILINVGNLFILYFYLNSWILLESLNFFLGGKQSISL